MTDFMDALMRKAIKAITDRDIHPDIVAKLREKARGLPLSEMLKLVEKEAMLTWREDDYERGGK